MQDSGGPTGPYDFASGQNLDSTWINDGFTTKVDANISGIDQYAMTVLNMGIDLTALFQTLETKISAITEDGAFWGGTPEMQYAFSALQTNSTEFGQFMQNVTAGVQSTSSAAQVVADAYSGSDAFGAASLEAIEFAFDLPGGKRPDGLAASIGQTYWQKQAADAAAAANQPPGPNNDDYRLLDQQSIPGGTLMTYVDTTTGQIRTVEHVYQNGHTIVTINSGGSTIVTDTSTRSDASGTVTVVKTTANGKTTTKQTNEYASASSDSYSQYSDEYDNDQLTTRNVVTNYSNGSKTYTTISYQDGKQTSTSSYTVGPDPTATPTAPDTPDQDQIQQLQKQKMAALDQGY